METAERMRLLVAPLIDEAAAELYDIEFAGGILRITVDQADGADMGVIAKLTRAISHLIDETDPIVGQFTLEVSSPGLERALRTPDHFRRAVGETVAVKTRPRGDEPRRCRGVLTAFDGDTLTITEGPADGVAPHRVSIDDVEKARTVFDWGPAPKPGRPKTSPSAKKKKAEKS